MSDAIYEAVSLGQLCQTKFQIARKLNAQGHPGRSEMALRLEMTPPGRGSRLFGWDFFDWMDAPIDAVSKCIECDFVGTFERDDLILDEDGNVIHRTLHINHVHCFEGPGSDRSSELLLNGLYASERRRYERRAQAFLERLSSPGPVLYIHNSIKFPTAEQTARLLAALGSKSPEHRFHVMFNAFIEHDQDLSAFADRVTKTPRGPRDTKPKGRDWEGDDASWEAALSHFNIAPPQGLVQQPRQPSEGSASQPAQAQKHFLSRLFAR